jgi:hypothetical protein
MSHLIRLNLNAKEISGIVPPYIMRLQKILPGNELVRDIYFKLTFRKNLGWKHSCVEPVEKIRRHFHVERNKVAFLTITKNPYSWLLSLYRRPYHQYYRGKKPDFETFLRSPWKTIYRDKTETFISNPMELWNIKNTSYIQLKKLNALNITTERIFEDAKAVIDRISSHFSIGKLSDKFIDYHQSTKDKNKDSNFYRGYYLNEKWRDNLSKDAIAIINEKIDRNLMAYFKYKRLN